jgi:hypothetical protein
VMKYQGTIIAADFSIAYSIEVGKCPGEVHQPMRILTALGTQIASFPRR